MRSLFPYRITEEHLFCRTCRNIKKHGIYAKEAYSTHGGLLPKIPLLCVCDFCKTAYLAFSQEFAFAKSEEDNYVKIPGMNRLNPGNWVYIKGTSKPGILKRFTNYKDKTSLVLDFGEAKDTCVEIENKEPKEQEISRRGYKLLPVQCGETLIGDFVYHVRRDMFGRAIGFVNDGNIDKLAVQLNDGIILFITLPESYQTLPNARIKETAKNKLQVLEPSVLSQIEMDAKHGVLFVSGQVESLAEKRKIQKLLDQILIVRGVINQIQIVPHIHVTDEILLNHIHEIFEKAKNRDTAYYKIQVENGHATIQLGYYKEQAIHYFENALEKLPGILELSVLPECVPIPTPAEEEKIKEARHNLEALPGLKNCDIQVTGVGKKIILSGFVLSLLQKKIVNFQIIKYPWQISDVENNLRIVAKKAET